MAYDVEISGISKDNKRLFNIKADWISGIHFISDKRFSTYEVNVGYLDLSASFNVSEMKKFHKENDTKFARDDYKDEMKFLDDALNIYGEDVYSRFVIEISEW